MADSRVKEDDLDFSAFHCCGDEDLYPFRCSGCGRPMVFCYECDTLFPDLRTVAPGREVAVNSTHGHRPIFACPHCRHSFEYYFMDNPAYHVSFEEWRAAGFGHLLRSE